MAADPDRPWEIDEPVAEEQQEPEKRYVFRVRYIINAIEPLELVRRKQGGRGLVVRDLEGGPEVDIPTVDTYTEFEDAKAKLVAANTERVTQIERDLYDANYKLRISKAMVMNWEA